MACPFHWKLTNLEPEKRHNHELYQRREITRRVRSWRDGTRTGKVERTGFRKGQEGRVKIYESNSSLYYTNPLWAGLTWLTALPLSRSRRSRSCTSEMSSLTSPGPRTTGWTRCSPGPGPSDWRPRTENEREKKEWGRLKRKLRLNGGLAEHNQDSTQLLHRFPSGGGWWGGSVGKQKNVGRIAISRIFFFC